MEQEFVDFTISDPLSSVTLEVEDQLLYVHKEVLAVWSPVFRSMFLGNFKESKESSIPLPGKKVDEFVELLHCMYPPIKAINDSNVYQLLPLVEEYQIDEVKKKCEEFLLTKDGNMELLVTAQQYGLHQLLGKCIDKVKSKSFTELKKDPNYKLIEPENLISILQLRVLDLEASVEQGRKIYGDRDTKMFGVISELASGYGNFCTECKSRKINDNCFNCLKMFREKVKSKCDEAKAYRQHNPLFSRENKEGSI